MLEIGLHPGIDHDVYHADPCERPSLSHSIALEIVRHSPAHARLLHPRLGAMPRGRATEQVNNGTILHALLLGGNVGLVPIEANDFRTKKAQEERDAAEAAGKVPILAHKLDRLRSAEAAIRKHLPRNPASATTELSAVWESDGVLCRARIDQLFQDHMLDDLKIVEDAAVSAADRNILSMGYHVEAAAHLEAIETLIPAAAGRARFILTFVEWERPEIGIQRREIRGQLLDLGRQQWARAKSTWAQCMAANVWPGYSTEIIEAGCPAWAASEEFEKQLSGQTEPF